MKLSRRAIYLGIAIVAVAVILAVLFVLQLENKSPHERYIELGRGYIWAYQSEACDEHLTDPEEIQECYFTIYIDQIMEYESTRNLKEHLVEANVCSKLVGERKDWCLQTLEDLNITI